MQLNGITLPIFPPPPADPTLRPADVLIRESDAGQSQHSPQTQHDVIVAMMRKQGYYPACIDGDESKGHVTTRPGYQRIKARIAGGLTEAVFVLHSSRLGRDASERIRLQRELKKLRVPIFSAQQGELRDDFVGGVYALMDQQFSIDLAFKIKNAMPAGVKEGKYPARTPVGYKRVWPEGQTYDRKARPEMVEDEHYGPLVRDIFRKYGLEHWSMRAIVGWLNSQVNQYPNPESDSGLWNRTGISNMLRKRAYIGEIEWGKRKSGYYDHYEGPILRSGVDDCAPARHKPLIDRSVWEAAQMRLDSDPKRFQVTTRKGRTPALLTGFLLCAGCGRPMKAQRERPSRRSTGAYICSDQDNRQSACREPRCAMSIAHPAVLREVARLRAGRPWTPAALDELAERDPHAEERARTEAEIAAARREVETNIRLLKVVAAAGDPDQETVAAFRRDNRALDARIKGLQAHLDELPCATALDLMAIEELHAQLAKADLAGLIANAQAVGDTLALRELLAVTVQSARITERVGGGRNGRTAWARAEVVSWTRQVDLFLEHGYLLLDPAAAAPMQKTRRERRAEAARRYRQRKRESRLAQRTGPDAPLKREEDGDGAR